MRNVYAKVNTSIQEYRQGPGLLNQIVRQATSGSTLSLANTIYRGFFSPQTSLPKSPANPVYYAIPKLGPSAGLVNKMGLLGGLAQVAQLGGSTPDAMRQRQWAGWVKQSGIAGAPLTYKPPVLWGKR